MLRGWCGSGHLAIVLGMLLAMVCVPSSTALAAETVTLNERLRLGLMVRTSDEFAFIDQVVARVEAGELPQKLVDRVFFWARQKARQQAPAAKQRRPMVYFRPALKILAKRIDVNLN